jgi:hypothetical protein
MLSTGSISKPPGYGRNLNLTQSLNVALADHLLDGFEIENNDNGASREFLRDIIISGHVPKEDLKEVVEVGLLRGFDEFNMIVDRATALRDRMSGAEQDPGLIFDCLGAVLAGKEEEVLKGTRMVKKKNPKKVIVGGEETGMREKRFDGTKPKKQKGVRNLETNVSRFWDEGEPCESVWTTRGENRKLRGHFDVADSGKDSNDSIRQSKPGSSTTSGTRNSGQSWNRDDWNSDRNEVAGDCASKGGVTDGIRSVTKVHVPKRTSKKGTRVTKSPFFGLTAVESSPRKTASSTQTMSSSTTPSKKKSRPLAGTVSGLPVPSLSEDRFGLIQEDLAHDPFRLLVAVTFLIKTTAKAALPVFYHLMERFPTPEALAAADPASEIIPMIRHLGLSSKRCTAVQKYARGWVARPPSRHARFGVKNYPRHGDGSQVRGGEEFGSEDEEKLEVGYKRKALGSAWEIGHLTQGRYAIDSWRIFCRDEMLGRADDWTGRGSREENFQPEWMRVLPEDKELRACLRWMWMKEGWAWDPVTGDREVLGHDLRLAVNEGRVGYDDLGDLIILTNSTGQR